MKNKKGTMKTGGIVLVILTIAVILFGMGIGGYFLFGALQKQATPQPSPSECGDSTGVLTVNAYNSMLQSSNLTPTLYVGVDGSPVTQTATSGTTTFGIGKKLVVFGSLSDYIDTSIGGTMICGGLRLDMPMYQSTSDNPAITIKDLDTSTTALTDNVAGGAVNVSNIAPGDVLNLEVKFQGTALESSGDGIYVIELPANSAANITAGDSGVTLGDLNHVTVPTVHTSQNAGSRVDAFDVPAIVGAKTSTYTLLISTGSSKDLSGGVYTDWYAKQAYVDTDGTVKVGVENSQGTAEYENTIDSDFYINAA